MRNDFKRSVAERWQKISAWKWRADRPYKLIAFAILPLLTIAILERLFAAHDLQWFRDWVKGSAIYGPLFFPDASTIEWKDRLQGVMLLLGLPVAFCLWHWRDKNVRDQIENTRKDINLKEFQEVQLRAAGALDEKLPQEAREQLQIAALHQLRGFLRGDYGESFKRPAFELLLAGHAGAVHRIGVPEVQAQLDGKSREQIQDAVTALRARLSPIDLTRMAIIRDEAVSIFTHIYPLHHRRFDLIDLSRFTFPPNIQMESSTFFGSEMYGCTLRHANLDFCVLDGTNLSYARLENSSFRNTYFRGSSLYNSRLQGCISTESFFDFSILDNAKLDNALVISSVFRKSTLRWASLQSANFTMTKLLGADMRMACLKRADLRCAELSFDTNLHDATFDSYSQFGANLSTEWHALSEFGKEAARAPWIARGMINVDAPPVTNSGSA